MKKIFPYNILHIASGDLWAGAEVQLHTLLTTLHTELGVKVIVILLNHGVLEKKLRQAGIEVAILDESKLNSAQILISLIRSIKEQKPNLVHTHRFKENILGSIAARIAGNIASLRTSHGAPEYSPSWRQPTKRIISTLDWLCGRYLQQKIIAVSDDLAIILNKDFPTKKICTIYNGINLNTIVKQAVNTKSSLIQKNDVFKIGLAGRLVPVKRVDIFIKTARYLRDNYQNLETSFHIFGDGPLYGNLNKLCQALEVDDIVHFEGHCDDIHSRLQQLDVLLMTSDHEGLPMILLESMALQTPIIAHAVGGIPTLLNQGACGILVYEHNAKGYGQAIYHLANNSDNRTNIAQKAFDQVKLHYSSEKNARGYLEEYDFILHV